MRHATRVVWSFVLAMLTVAAAAAQTPEVITYISPADNATGQSVTPTLEWFGDPVADDYRIRISKTPDQTNVILNQIATDTTFTPAAALENGEQYFWNVRGRNSEGLGPGGGWWAFVTEVGGATQVVLSSPSSGASDIDVETGLSWSSVPGAATYRVQVSTSANFGTTVVDNPSVATTSLQVMLNPSQTYFWRVLASNAGAFNWSETWSFTTGAGTPEQVVLISPADGAANVSATPELSWQEDAAATNYRVHISTTADFSNLIHNLIVATTTWTPPALANATVHYWRVRAIGPGGAGPFSTPRSFIVEAGGATQVKLSSPLNGATSVELNPVLSWMSVSGGSPYRLQVSKNQNMSSPDIDESGINGTQFEIDELDPTTDYYWRVIASNAPSNNWSDTWSFQTGTGQPGTVALLTPADGATNVPISTSFAWEADPSSESYRLQVATESNFNANLRVVDEQGITETSFTPGDVLDSGTTLYWRVRGINSVGGGPWSATRSFTTAQSAPGAVTLVSPANNATNVPATPTLNWQAEAVSDAYDVQVATSADFAVPIISALGLTDTSFGTTTLANGTPHFWRVRGSNSAGKGPWSNAFAFTTTAGGPQQVELSSPANNAVDVGLNPMLNWGAVANAVSYALQVSTQSNFSSTVINRDAVTVTQFQTTDLEGQTKYYWRVRASNAGPANWSATWSFTTSPGTPDQVNLQSPADKAQNITVNTILTWNQSPNADYYELQMTELEDDYSEIYLQTSNIQGTQYQVPELIYGEVYWWRVRAVNDSGPGPWSDSWGYLTVRGGPHQPLIVSPAPGETGISLEPLLVWSSVPEELPKTAAVTYHVQIATSFSFTGGSIVLEETQHPDTTLQVTGLLPDTTYAWRVRASVAGQNNWTITSSFVTGKGVPSQVVLDAPEDGSTEIPLETTLTWTAPLRATSFHVQVSLDSQFTSVIIDETGLSDISLNVVELDPMTDYYWRVQGVNQDGVGEWSGTWKFSTVGLSAPVAPVLISPLNGAAEVGIAPLFTWNPSETASSYKLEISTNPIFSTVVLAVVVAQPFYQASGLLVGQEYFWRVEARNAGGSNVSDIWGFTTVQTTDTEAEEIPDEFALEQNYPNPFNPSTTIEFAMPVGGQATLVVYNVRGEAVARLVEGSLPAGHHRVVWNASSLPSGVYLYRLQTGEFVSTKKLTLAK